MAKKKSRPVEPDLIEEVIEEAAEVEESVVESEPEVPAKVVEEPKANDVDQWYYAQLKVINNLSDKAKARRLAARITKNRKGI